MSKYTTEVRYLCESLTDLGESVGFNSLEDKRIPDPNNPENYIIVEGVLSKAASKIFDFDFPIFDENYRIILEKKILRHYYTREICEETYGLWKLRLCDKLNIIMPYYNQMYESELLEFNPFYDVNYKRTHKGNQSDLSKRNETSKHGRTNTSVKANDQSVTSEGGNTGSISNASRGESNENSENLNLFSATPQGSVSRLDFDTNGYLTDARKINENNSVSNSQNSVTQSNVKNNEKTNTENRTSANENEVGENNVNSSNNKISFDEYVDEVIGKQSYENNSSLLKQFRETFLNIDSMIIEELSDLFFGLW